MRTTFLWELYMGLLYPLLYPGYVMIIPMYNVHRYFSLKNLGKKTAHYTQQNTVIQCPASLPYPEVRGQGWMFHSFPLCGCYKSCYYEYVYKLLCGHMFSFILDMYMKTISGRSFILFQVSPGPQLPLTEAKFQVSVAKRWGVGEKGSLLILSFKWWDRGSTLSSVLILGPQSPLSWLVKGWNLTRRSKPRRLSFLPPSP